jgi:prepilin-type N-terminal cleavage/methylation domain-containing protein
MKKLGFTLAEVLITLGIVGVIAAITLPALMADTTSAQIGPKLAKAVATFEQANEVLLNQNGVDTLSDIGFADQQAYATELSKFLKISKISNYPAHSYSAMGTASSDGGTTYLSKDGVVYIIYTANYIETGEDTRPAYKRSAGQVWIDINGTSKPNVEPVDVFCFRLMEDGTLAPYGGEITTELGHKSWTEGCAKDSAPTDPATCAGHIFENNLKVLYK